MAEPNYEVNSWDICAEAIRWLQAAQEMFERARQCRSLVISLDRDMGSRGEDWRAIKARADRVYNSAMSAEHFFLESVRNSHRWLKALSMREQSIRDAVAVFLEKTKLVPGLRDMREHADDYLLPEGKPQRKGFLTSGSLPGGVSFAVDATSNISTGSDVLLGGRISSNEVLAAVCELLPVLEAAHDGFSSYHRLNAQGN